MKSLDEVVLDQLEAAGMERTDEVTIQLSDNLVNLFSRQLERGQIAAVVTELEKAAEQKNKILIVSTGKVAEDPGQRNMVDPKLLLARAKNLRNKLGS